MIVERCETCGSELIDDEPQPLCFTCQAIIRQIAQAYGRALAKIAHLAAGKDGVQ